MRRLTDSSGASLMEFGFAREIFWLLRRLVSFCGLCVLLRPKLLGVEQFFAAKTSRADQQRTKRVPRSITIGFCLVAGRRNFRALRRLATISITHLLGVVSDAKEIEMQSINELCSLVRETAYAIHLYFGHGHLEKVYENALAHRLRNEQLHVRQQQPLIVYDEDNTIVGEYFADLLVEERLIVEIKAAKSLAAEHVAQMLGYLKCSRIEHGLLINFGSFKFQIKKYILSTDVRVPTKQ
jgi:GxxExxY protein